MTRPHGAEPASFDALLTPLLGPAYGLAYSLVGDRAEAEDAVQEAALRALRAFHTFETGTNFRAWFYRIVTNCCFGRHRQRKRRPETVAFDEVPELYLYERTAEAGLHALSDDPATLVMRRLTAEQVQAAVHALPEEFRAVAALFFLEDAGYEEIAAVLDIPIGTVRSRLHRARRMLQRSLWRVAEEAGVVAALTEGRPA